MTTTTTHKAESNKTTHSSNQPFFQKKKEGNGTAVSNVEKDTDTRNVAGESRADEVETDISLEQDIQPLENETSEDLDIIVVDEDITADFPPQEEVQLEEIAKVEKLATTGSSEEVANAFTEASPSQMAVSYGDMGQVINQKFSDEQGAMQAEAPTLKASTSGKVEEGITPPGELSTATEATIKEESFTKPPTPQVEAHPEGKKAVNKGAVNAVLRDLPDEDFGNQVQENFQDVLRKIPASDNGVSTSAGTRPTVNTSGEANVNRSDNLQNQSKNQLQKESGTVETAFKNHPGQQNIQAKHIDEPYTAQLTNDTKQVVTQEHQALKDYSEAALPEDVRAQADLMLTPALQEKMAKAKTDIGTAANQRDTEKQQKYTEAENKAAELNKAAEAEQKQIVINNRKKVAEQQQAGIKESREEIKKFDSEASGKKKTLKSDINTKIKTAEKEADSELKKGEAQARNKKKESEKQAAKKKRELAKKKENQGFFSRVASAIKFAINSIVNAINAIFDALRKAVKTFIEAAKKLALKAVESARKWVVDKLNTFRDWAKNKVNEVLKNFPGIAKRINKLIDAAVNIAITCKIAGVDPKIVFGFLDRAKNSITGILKNPVGFFNFLVQGIGTGIRNFGKNVKKHLMTGLIGWLTGALASTGIEIPQKFDVAGIFKLVTGILGLTYENIKQKIIRRFPPAEKVFGAIEATFNLLVEVRERGPIVLWEKVKDKFTDLKGMVIGGIRDFLAVKVVKAGLVWLLSLTNPAGAIVKVVQLLYKLVMFLVERFQQIKDFVLSIYNTLAAIASGNLSKLIKGIEGALSGSLPVFISLFATVLGLGGITGKVKKIIAKVSKPVNKFIDKLIKRVIDWVRKFIKKIKKEFKTKDGEDHSLFFKGSGKNAVLMIASDETKYSYFIKNIDVGQDEGKKVIKTKAISIAEEIDKLKNEPVGAKTKKETEKNKKDKENKIKGKLKTLSSLTVQLFGLQSTDELPDSVVTYPQKKSTKPLIGKEMVATTITRKPVKDAKHKGSPPTQAKHAIYDKLNLRRKAGVSYYVRGHLLNDNIHGPGQWYNMVPLSRQGNANHLNPSEYIVKNSTLSGAVISYSVKAVYGREKNNINNDRKELEKGNIDEGKIEDILTVRKFEHYVPTNLILNAALLGLDEKGKFTVKLKNLLTNKKVDNEVEEDVTKYETGKGKPKKVVSLLNSSIEEIVENTGLNETRVSYLQHAAKYVYLMKKGKIASYSEIIDYVKNDTRLKYQESYRTGLIRLLRRMDSTTSMKNKIRNIRIH